MKKIKLYTLAFIVSALAVTNLALPAYASTAGDKIREGVDTAAGEDSNSEPKDLTTLIKQIINILSVIIGAVAVVMLIIGGFRYVTSAGNDTAVASAKNTILYAIVGLVIVALAQVIVQFVLGGLTSSSAQSTPNSSTTSKQKDLPAIKKGLIE